MSIGRAKLLVRRMQKGGDYLDALNDLINLLFNSSHLRGVHLRVRLRGRDKENFPIMTDQGVIELGMVTLTAGLNMVGAVAGLWLTFRRARKDD